METISTRLLTVSTRPSGFSPGSWTLPNRFPGGDEPWRPYPSRKSARTFFGSKRIWRSSIA